MRKLTEKQDPSRSPATSSDLDDATSLNHVGVKVPQRGEVVVQGLQIKPGDANLMIQSRESCG